MEKKSKVTAILVLSLPGLGFSGYLSVAELSGGAVCPTVSSVIGIPPCVIGLFVYVLIFIIALSLLKSLK